jgi:acylphosphatase
VETPQEQRERREIHYAGRVQGVGFRYTTRQIAARFDVQGFVQNLADGRVLLVVEGPGGEVERFVDEVRLELGRYVQSAQSVSREPRGDFPNFEIRR